MEPHLVTYLVIIVICVIMSAYFSATETAFSTFNKIRVKTMAEKGNKKAALALKLEDNYDSLISTILIGNNIVNILAASLGTLFFTGILASNADLAATVSTVVLTVVVLVFGEISPKTIAKNMPEKFVLFSAPIINFIRIILTPFNFVFKAWQTLLAKIFKSSDDKGMTEEELISIIEEAEEEGGIDEEESSLIKSAIEFGDLEVSDIFTPRRDITALPADADKATIAKTFAESGYSRIPIYEGDLDNVIGILYYKDFYTKAFGKSTPITDIIKPVMFVATTQQVNELMKELQDKQLHLAVVTDEYGSTAGIVTLEDILEEIVGEIWDEHDEVVEEIKEIGEKEYIVSGKANTDKLFDLLDITTDEESDLVTINGWAMEALGRLPEVGDVFEEHGLKVEVLELDGRRIENVHVTDLREDEADEDENEEKDKDSSDGEQQTFFKN
ncbi:MAG: HlyC/CorC family transporter [Clostridia bacterium]|nr:HlyC/CorC family transporter [Clostridia bacterium]MBR3805613.1 HlyC/CorC family transporter [Clostridia bacterium]